VARRLVEAGAQSVQVNTAVKLTDKHSWDTHGRQPFASIKQLRDHVAPAYDQAVAALIDDLHQRGRLERTLVCCLAEFGRTPHMNPDGGRDHWPQCFTNYFAGGGVQGGRVVGRSDRFAGQPADRPVEVSEIAATIRHSLRRDAECLKSDHAGVMSPSAAAASPVWELF
jgi:uncharacterized protein (DUF1501 family)